MPVIFVRTGSPVEKKVFTTTLAEVVMLTETPRSRCTQA